MDVNKLEQSFKQLQRLLHPDKFSKSSDKEQEYSTSHSSLINHAYQTLKNPQQRAKYMLEHLFHVDIDEMEVPQELLLEMMELMEQIHENHSPDELLEYKGQIQDRMQQIYRHLAKSFDERDVNRAKQQIAELNYLSRLDKQIHEKLA